MDHYDRMANYARTVARLFQNQQVFDWAIVQSEALALLHSLGVQIPCKVITFSAANPRADLVLDRGLLVGRLPNWSGPLLNMGNCRLQGPHQAENMLAALAVGHVLRLRLEEMVEALQTHEGGSHRCELVGEAGGVSFVNDSKAMNVEALRRAIESMPGGRIGEPNLWLIAGGKDKGLDYHDLGPLIAQRVKGTFLLGQTRDKLRAAWSLFTPCTSVDSLEEAVELASAGAVAGALPEPSLDRAGLQPAASRAGAGRNPPRARGRRAARAWRGASHGRAPPHPWRAQPQPERAAAAGVCGAWRSRRSCR
jgi:UDP-N-acetylmuramoylalanine--D-glutamate ligase